MIFFCWIISSFVIVIDSFLSILQSCCHALFLSYCNGWRAQRQTAGMTCSILILDFGAVSCYAENIRIL
ncbi:hypothetical protein MITSMUL_03718 [Mitsuokella multacida DSM 20544]|uniref:Uncharacterized protein n=1 Tax=Mitsuokella multacida DSM 20544 TaxID=500635 RepID=C9KKL7_9FIRM|nr:hypothetical protein MITSMUL_03718 [Mitsuokella multacida DSM 20544]